MEAHPLGGLIPPLGAMSLSTMDQTARQTVEGAKEAIVEEVMAAVVPASHSPLILVLRRRRGSHLLPGHRDSAWAFRLRLLRRTTAVAGVADTIKDGEVLLLLAPLGTQATNLLRRPSTIRETTTNVGILGDTGEWMYRVIYGGLLDLYVSICGVELVSCMKICRVLKRGGAAAQNPT